MKKLSLSFALIFGFFMAVAQMPTHVQIYAPYYIPPVEEEYGNYKTFDYYVLSDEFKKSIQGRYTPAIYRLKQDTLVGDFNIITMVTKVSVSSGGVQFDTARVSYSFNLCQVVFDKDGDEVYQSRFTNKPSSAKSLCEDCIWDDKKTSDSLIKVLARPALSNLLNTTACKDISNRFMGGIGGELTLFLGVSSLGFKFPPEMKRVTDSINSIKKASEKTPEEFRAAAARQIPFWKEMSVITGVKKEVHYRTSGMYNLVLCNLFAGNTATAEELIETQPLAKGYKAELKRNVKKEKGRPVINDKPKYIHDESMKPKYNVRKIFLNLFAYSLSGAFILKKNAYPVRGLGVVWCFNIHDYGPGMLSLNREDFKVDITTNDGKKSMRLSDIITVESDSGLFVVKKLNSLSKGITYSLLKASFDSGPLKVYELVFPKDLPDWTRSSRYDVEDEAKELGGDLESLFGKSQKKQTKEDETNEEPAKSKSPRKPKVKFFYQKDEKDIEGEPSVGGGRWLEKYFSDCPTLAEKIKKGELRTPKEIGEYYIKNRK